MSYSNKKILSIISKAKKPKAKSFLFHDKKENMLCFTYWCYRVEEKKMKLSELKPQHTPNISSKFYKNILQDIKTNGFDYNKGIIIVRKENLISDGHHRYTIMKKVFGLNYEVSVLKILDDYNPILHYLYLTFVIKPITLIYRLILLLIELFFAVKKYLNSKIWNLQKN